jgi:hypothetical protein
MRALHWDAINPLTGTPYTWDDPNLRWGDPAYALEPGDPGFVPYSTPATPLNPTSAKSKKMKHQAYYPTNAAAQIVWLENFRNKLTGHAPTLGISGADSTAAIADARWLIYVLGTWLPAVRAWQKSCTDAARQAQLGNMGVVMVLPVFVAPALPAGVVAVNDGALNRIFGIIQVMKGSAAYTEAIGTDLGVIGSQQSAPDFATLQPSINATVAGPNKVDNDWGWGGFAAFLDACEIQVDRGSGWTLLTIDTTPGYTDTAPHPATLTRWKYRAIYHVDDAQVGLWSAEVSVTVGG